MSELPKGWVAVPLENLGKYLNGAAFKPSDWTDEGVPIIRIQNLTDWSKPFNYTKRIVSEELRIENGDILVSWSATLDAFIWDRGEAWLNQHIFRVLPNTGIIEKQFLFFLLKHEIAALIKTLVRLRDSSSVKFIAWYLISQSGQAQLLESNRGMTRAGLGLDDIRAVNIPLPSIAEQKEIVRQIEGMFEAIDRMEREYQQAVKLCNRLEQATLAKAFRGELVPQDPDDEPASVLLERIRAQRQAQPKKGKAGKSKQLTLGEIVPD